MPLLLVLLQNRFVWGALLVAALGASHVAAYYTGYFRGVSAERAAWEVERQRIIAAAAAEADRLRVDGRRLAAELASAQAQIRVEYVEVIREVRAKASATRACFQPDITAILNREAPIRERVERPDGTRVAVEHASPPSGGTSEAAAAEWVANARTAHEACRAQLGKLAEWVRLVTGD